jgi:glycogen(starch) synthase
VNELLRDGEEYLGFAPRDPRGLADKILALGKNRREAREMAERARRRVHEVCDWKRIAGDYARLYRDTIGAERAGGLVKPNEDLLPAAGLPSARSPAAGVLPAPGGRGGRARASGADSV